MRKKSIFICLAIAFVILNPFFSNAEDEILWSYLNLPPIHIEAEPFANKGYADFVLQLLIHNMDGYKHNILNCNMGRTMIMFRNQEKIGHPAILKTSDRENYIEFSIPAYVLIPNGVLMPKNHLNQFKPYMNNEGQFLIEKAITQSDLRAGISFDRAYGGIIDSILIKYKNHKNIVVNYVDKPLTKNLFAMMQLGRIDYLIGYPIEGQYYAKVTSNSENIIYLPIAGMPEYILGYIGFPKNEWGKTIIKKINTILEKHRNTHEYQDAYEFWLDENSVERYRKYVREVYGIGN